MLFLAVLLTAFALVAALPRRGARRPLREAARVAMGAAFVVAGLSHFAAPDPFVQHLPEWVPSREGLVALTGVVEVVLGAGLVGPARLRPAAALAVAAYLVAVFPANVHVALAGVDVDGQPGGAYPWLRLTLQPLFVAWALSSVPGAVRRLRVPSLPLEPAAR